MSKSYSLSQRNVPSLLKILLDASCIVDLFTSITKRNTIKSTPNQEGKL